MNAKQSTDRLLAFWQINTTHAAVGINGEPKFYDLVLPVKL